MEIERVVSKEVEDQGQLTQRPIFNHALGLGLVQVQTFADAYYERDLLAEAEDLSSVTAATFEFVEAIDEFFEVGASRGECSAEGVEEVLDDSAHLVAPSACVNNGEHLLEDRDERSLLSRFAHFIFHY